MVTSQKSINSNNSTIKFLCSYGGKILLRHGDGKLRYVGGHTRVLSVDRSISFAELLVKLGEMCESSVMLRCKLPTEDLDALVSVTSDEDLANVIEEYDRVSSDLKIRAILSPRKSLKKVSPVSSAASSVDFSASSTSSPHADDGYHSVLPKSPAKSYGCTDRIRQPPIGIPVGFWNDSTKVRYYPCLVQRNPSYLYLVPQWNQ